MLVRFVLFVFLHLFFFCVDCIWCWFCLVIYCRWVWLDDRWLLFSFWSICTIEKIVCLRYSFIGWWIPFTPVASGVSVFFFLHYFFICLLFFSYKRSLWHHHEHYHDKFTQFFVLIFISLVFSICFSCFRHSVGFLNAVNRAVKET